MAIRVHDNLHIISCPKCGSNSVRGIVREVSDEPARVRTQFGMHDRYARGVPQPSQILATARNPWHRLASGYVWEKTLFQDRKRRAKGDFPEWYSPDRTFEEYVQWYIIDGEGEKFFRKHDWGWIGCGYTLSWWYRPAWPYITGWIRCERMVEDMRAHGIAYSGHEYHANATRDPDTMATWWTLYDKRLEQEIYDRDRWFFDTLYPHAVPPTEMPNKETTR